MTFSATDEAFSPGSLVLVTGASGFIATHVVDQLLLAGYHVRGTVRDEKKAAWTTELFTSRHGAGKFTAVIVPDMSIDGAFDSVVKDVQGIIHTASNTTFSPDPNLVIPPTIAGVVSLLRSATATPSVKSFVFTSSSAAVPGPDAADSITTSDYNDAAIAASWSVTSPPYPATHAVDVYSASKAEAEKAFWKFVEEEKPSFRVNTVIPDFNAGEVLSLKGSLSTGAFVRMVWENGTDFVKNLPRPLVSKDVNKERIFAYAGAFTWNYVLAIFRKLNPKKTFADDIPGAQVSTQRVPIERAEQLLKDVFGREGFTGLEESVEENVKDLA